MFRFFSSLTILLCLIGCTSQKTISTNQESMGPGKAMMLKPNPTSSQMDNSVSLSSSPENPQIATSDQTEILWDEWGVPHIYAKDKEELFYAFGWAQMHSHANTILKLYGTSRGRGAEYWGEKKLQSDMMVHTLGFPKLALSWYEQQSKEFKSYIDHFAKGMNDYADAHPDAINEEYKMVLPISKHDMLKHALFVLYSRFVGGGDLQRSAKWAERGSNTFAVGPSRSASGKAMLVMNPHLPWFDEWLFYEGHFNAPGVHTYGATLVGLPTLGIAFNEHLGWSHTNNTIDNADLYELTLKDDGYVVDGKVRSFEVSKYALKVKGEDGRITVRDMKRIVSPDHGPVLNQNSGKALAIKMPGYDRPYGVVQWWNMSTATNFDEFKSALKKVQIPFFNIMYADVAGNIFYMFNGQVPKRKTGGWDFWQGIIDGSKSENLWTDVHTYEELPKTENPGSGYLQNANDPPWTSTFPMVLNPKDYPPYMAPVRMTFRPQRAARMMDEDNSITFDELTDYKTSTRIEMADRLLDDLNVAVDKYGKEDSREAMRILNAWDREANGNSKGMALFYAWAHALGPYNQKIYATQWSLDKARTTPDGLADPEGAVKALDEVIAQFKKAGTSLDVSWGETYRIKYGNKDLPGNGADGSVGIFRVAWSGGLEEDGKYYIQGGDSWQSVIEFGDKIRAKVLMSYGNSTQEDSPHYGDQLELFSKKEMRECLFYKEDVLKHVAKKEVLKIN